MSITGLYIYSSNGNSRYGKMGDEITLYARVDAPYSGNQGVNAKVYIDNVLYGTAYANYDQQGEGEYLIPLTYFLPDLTKTKQSYSIEFAYGPYTCSMQVSLPDPVKILGLSNTIIGNNFSFSIDGIAENFKCKLYLKIGYNMEFLKEVTFQDCFEDEVLLQEGLMYNYPKIKAEYRFAKYFRNLVTTTAKIICETYNGTKLLGTKEGTFQLKVPDNETTKPAISSVILSPITELNEQLSALYIRGKTGLKAQISATSEYSNIAKYEVTAGSVGAEGNPGNIEVLVNDGYVTVTVTVTDARGFRQTVTRSIYVYPYSRPKIVPYSGYSDIVCERAKATGELHSDGTYLAIMAGKRFTSIMKDGAELNSCRLRYRFKPTTVDTFGDWVTLLSDGSVESEIQVLAGNVVSSTNASYDIELSAIDRVGSEHVIRFSVMTSAISFVLYDGVDGAAFGKYPEEPHVVDIAAHMTLRVRGRLEVLGSSWASLGLADGMNESSYAYGRQDDTGCYYQVSNGNHVQAAFNCSYNYAGRSQVINLTPIPEEYRPERTVCSICPTNDRRLALVTVQPDGYIRIEWVQTIAATSNTASATVLWVDGYLDYWT